MLSVGQQKRSWLDELLDDVFGTDDPAPAAPATIRASKKRVSIVAEPAEGGKSQKALSVVAEGSESRKALRASMYANVDPALMHI